MTVTTGHVSQRVDELLASHWYDEESGTFIPYDAIDDCCYDDGDWIDSAAITAFFTCPHGL